MMNRKKARVNLSPELLLDALAFPPNTEVYGASWSFHGGWIELWLTHPDFPEIEEGHEIPVLNPSITLIGNHPPNAFFEFDWNFPKGEDDE